MSFLLRLARLARIGLFMALSYPAVVLALIGLWSIFPPVSALMLSRSLTGRQVTRDYVSLDRIAPTLTKAVIVSEDAKFCRHHGVDWEALNIVLEEADEDGPARGASTIAMQTARNLFLWPGRSVVRKGAEIVLAYGLDFFWSKRRLMEVYLNIAEWGPDGIFGIEAAARKNYGKSAADLSAREAAFLTKALPNPILRDPANPGPGYRRLARALSGRLAEANALADCLALEKF